MKLLTALTEEEILEAIPENPKDIPNDYEFMQDLHNAGIFAIPTCAWLRPLATKLKGKKCLEIMAGRGIVSLALKKLGVDVVTTDNMSWSEGKFKCGDKMKTSLLNNVSVEKLSAKDAVDKYDADVLICCWPPDSVAYNTDFLDACIQFMKKNPSGKIIYVGEGETGCCASYEFFEHFDIEIIEECDNYPTLIGMYDHVYLAVPEDDKEKLS